MGRRFRQGVMGLHGLAEGKRTHEWVRVAGVYGVPVNRTCFQISIRGEHKSFKEEAWNFGLSNRKDRSAIYQARWWNQGG